MTIYDCDTTRDLLPSLVCGDVLPHERVAAEQHLDGCADCAAEAGIVRLLQQSLEPVPAGLEARVIGALDQAASRRRGVPARLAMAATITLAVLGGAFALDRLVEPELRPDEMMLAEFELPTGALLGWVTDGDPLLHGGATLDELTVEELELLLAELES